MNVPSSVHKSSISHELGLDAFANKYKIQPFFIYSSRLSLYCSFWVMIVRVVRGGSWNNNSRNARSAIRNRNAPDNRNNNIGFRVVSLRQHSTKAVRRFLARIVRSTDRTSVP